jgi:hypothetical protein
MSARVLGVRPTSPGFKTLAVRPTLCDLTWAKGIVPTPHGDVAVAWKLGEDRLAIDVNVPAGTEADIDVPTERFETATVQLDGRQAEPKVRVTAGQHHLLVTGRLKSRPAPPVEEDAGSGECDALESHVVKDDLLHRYLARSEDRCSHSGGGTDAGALLNGTTHNGSGGSDTADDGKTFRGYGSGDWLTLHLKQPCNISEIRTFAGHGDARASQQYVVTVAYAAEPEKFVKIATGSKKSSGGASELCLPVKAKAAVAVRFDFQSGPLGFNVYREINLLGQAAE